MPTSLIAKYLYGDREIVRTKARFDTHATVAMAGRFGLVFLPTYWFSSLGTGFAFAHVACHAVYVLTFGLTVCPVCAIRDSCPGGKLHRLVQRG